MLLYHRVGVILSIWHHHTILIHHNTCAVPIFDRAQATCQHVAMCEVFTESDSLTATEWCILLLFFVVCHGLRSLPDLTGSAQQCNEQ